MTQPPVIGLHLRAFNWHLWKHRKDAGLTLVHLSALTGIPGQTIQRFEGLKQRPTPEQADEIASALNADVAELFPPAVLAKTQSSVPSSVRLPIPASALPALDEGVQPDIKQLIAGAISTLKPRERKIIEMRFGLGEEEEHSREAIGREFHVTSERIRQIEAKALRKLRHPSRSKKLRGAL